MPRATKATLCGAVLSPGSTFRLPTKNTEAKAAMQNTADGVKTAAARGVVAIAQPGGSKKDDDVIRAANEAGVAMIFTGVRHFRH